MQGRVPRPRGRHGGQEVGRVGAPVARQQRHLVVVLRRGQTCVRSCGGVAGGAGGGGDYKEQGKAAKQRGRQESRWSMYMEREREEEEDK